jgi:hypothetical protein
MEHLIAFATGSLLYSDARHLRKGPVDGLDTVIPVDDAHAVRHHIQDSLELGVGLVQRFFSLPQFLPQQFGRFAYIVTGGSCRRGRFSENQFHLRMGVI